MHECCVTPSRVAVVSRCCTPPSGFWNWPTFFSRHLADIPKDRAVLDRAAASAAAAGPPSSWGSHPTCSSFHHGPHASAGRPTDCRTARAYVNPGSVSGRWGAMP